MARIGPERSISIIEKKVEAEEINFPVPVN